MNDAVRCGARSVVTFPGFFAGLSEIDDLAHYFSIGQTHAAIVRGIERLRTPGRLLAGDSAITAQVTVISSEPQDTVS